MVGHKSDKRNCIYLQQECLWICLFVCLSVVIVWAFFILHWHYSMLDVTFIPLLSLLCSGTLSEGLSDVFNAECISPHQRGLSHHKLHYSTLCITHYTTLQNNIFCLPSCHLSFCQYHQNHQGQMSLLPQYFQAMKEYVTISEHYSQGINLKVKQSSGQSAKLSIRGWTCTGLSILECSVIKDTL